MNKRRMAYLTSPNNNAMLFNQGYKLATTFHSLHAGPIACRQLLHHLHSMLNTACQQNRSDTFFRAYM